MKKICHDFDQKHRLLMIENEQIRQCLVEVHRNLNRLFLIHRSPNEPFSSINDDENQSFEQSKKRKSSFSFDRSNFFRIDGFTVGRRHRNRSTSF